MAARDSGTARVGSAMFDLLFLKDSQKNAQICPESLCERPRLISHVERTMVLGKCCLIPGPHCLAVRQYEGPPCELKDQILTDLSSRPKGSDVYV